MQFSKLRPNRQQIEINRRAYQIHMRENPRKTLELNFFDRDEEHLEWIGLEARDEIYARAASELVREG